MPRYYVHTYGPDACFDDEGVEVRDLSALRDLLHQSLADILRDEGRRTGATAFTAEAFDEAGHLVMSATASLTITGASSEGGTAKLDRR